MLTKMIHKYTTDVHLEECMSAKVACFIDDLTSQIELTTYWKDGGMYNCFLESL